MVPLPLIASLMSIFLTPIAFAIIGALVLPDYRKSGIALIIIAILQLISAIAYIYSIFMPISA